MCAIYRLSDGRIRLFALYLIIIITQTYLKVLDF